MEPGDSEKKDQETIIEPFDTKWASTNIDAIWHYLGRYGRYQTTQLFLYLYVAINLSIVVVNGMFTGKRLEYTCAEGDTSAKALYVNQTTEVTSCWVKVLDNVTAQARMQYKCSEYEYEGDGKTLSYTAEFDLVCDREILARLPQILTMLGMFAGASGLPHLGDRFGRKKLLLGSFAGLFLVSLVTSFVDSFGLLLLLKFLAGACQQGTMVPIYNLQLEVMPLELRPLVSMLQSSMWAISVSLTGALGYFMRDYWRDLQLAYGLTFLPGLICLCFTDESLRWLVINCKTKEAERVLRKACRWNNKDFDTLLKTFVTSGKGDQEPLVINISTSQGGNRKTEEEEESFSFKVLITNRYMRKVTLAMCYTWMISSLMYYGLTLMSTSLAGDPYMNFFLVALAEVPAAFYSYFTMKIIGRKKTIMYSNAVAGCALLLALLVTNLAPSSEGYRILLICLPLVGKLAISGTFGTLWTYTPELYPTNLRSYGVGISSTAARVGANFSPLFTLLAQKAPWVPGTLFAIVCFVSVYLMSLMPETKYKELPRTLTDVDAWFERGGNDGKDVENKGSTNSKEQ